jgi:hypothetical protein
MGAKDVASVFPGHAVKNRVGLVRG